MSRRAPLFAALLSVLVYACEPSGGQGPGTAGGSGGSVPSTGGSGGRGGAPGGGGTGGSAGSPANPDTAPPPSTPDGGTPPGPDAAPAVMGDCTPALPKSVFCDPLGTMPKSIKETGLFPSAPDFSKHPASLREFVPSPALWSDGLEKQRFILLPKGTKVDNSDPTYWMFPTGTLFIKTFFDDSGTGGKIRPIETRIIRSAKDVPYQFYVYQWDATGTDATLVVDDTNGDTDKEILVDVTVKHMVGTTPLVVNNGMPFKHSLPSRRACGECHSEHVEINFLGFDELRLNSKLSETSTKTQLQELFDAGVFTTAPRADAATVKDATMNDGGRMLRIKRFVYGNCYHCHNGNGLFNLHPDVFEMTVVNKPTDSQSVVPPRGWLRVVPGSPNTSVLYVQMERTKLPAPTGGMSMNRLRAMPPVGVADPAADQAALKDVRDWIMALPRN